MPTNWHTVYTKGTTSFLYKGIFWLMNGMELAANPSYTTYMEENAEMGNYTIYFCSAVITANSQVRKKCAAPK